MLLETDKQLFPAILFPDYNRVLWTHLAYVKVYFYVQYLAWGKKSFLVQCLVW